MTPEPLLDLSTLAPTRPAIRIDGVEYELSVIADFGAVGLYRLESLALAAEKINTTKRKDYTEQTAIDLSVNLSSQVKLIVLELPDDVLDKLSDSQKGAILTVFSQAVSPDEEPPPPVRRRNQQTGEKSSPASSDFTAAAPAVGST